METCKHLESELPSYQSSTFAAVAEQLRWFAGPPIRYERQKTILIFIHSLNSIINTDPNLLCSKPRNGASLGGNICTASPISDLNPLWMASGTVFTVAGKDTGEREIPAESFFLGYRKVDMAPHEVLTKVIIM